MTQDSRDIATAYWDDAVYDPAGTLLADIARKDVWEGDDDEPLKFKIYRGLPRQALALPALKLPVPAEPTAWVDGFSNETLSTFLYYAYGINRHDLQPGAWPFHRMVPSARCLFPTELYMVLPEEYDRPSGVYYYDPMHHTIVRLRDGDLRVAVGAALRADLSTSMGAVLLSSIFWKTAFKYRDYAYRLCTQEAGMVAGNVLLVASALGMEGHVHYLFLDRMLNRLLGLNESEENTLLALPLYKSRARARNRQARPGLGPAAEEFLFNSSPDLIRSEMGPSSFDPGNMPVLTRISHDSFITSQEQVRSRTSFASMSLASTKKARRITAPPWFAAESFDLATALRTRNSGPAYLDFADGSAASEVAWRVAHFVMQPYPTDILPDGDPPPCDCYLAVRSVSDIDEGVYRVITGGGALEPLRKGPVAAALRAISATSAGGLRIPNVNVSSANLTVFIAAPREAAIERFGPRSFRLLNLAAGLAAQRVCVMSARGGLTARVHNGYSARMAEEVIGLSGSGSSVLFQIAIGAARSRSELRLPVIF